MSHKRVHSFAVEFPHFVSRCAADDPTPLASHGRVLVGEGVLTKMCRKKQKPRQFFLFNDILVYGNILINKKKYNKQHIIPLEEVKLDNLGDDGTGLKNGWLIRTPTKSFAVYAATATEKTEWMAHINKCVEDTIRKTGKYPTKEHAAVWVPDAEAGYCMHCRKTQFTMLNRRVRSDSFVNHLLLQYSLLYKWVAGLIVLLWVFCFLDKTEVSSLNIAVQQKVDKPVTGADSSGDDDSDYDDDDNRQSTDNGLSKDMDGLTFDEKPTFYGDMMEAKSPEVELAEEAKAVPASPEQKESNSLQDASPTYENAKREAPAVDSMAGGEPHPDGH
ncbi:hypothetical protein HPB51_004607 [Rhipicephalus microplus]|uniref:PH domain-containing protein n=1 Tax=Rhipicephalus microplus TaxID=6941 RepID=A0A9J6ELZ6_RHIMP|nr:hypothetical protein HPB51_004607 [Rhipicephalus microplus]